MIETVRPTITPDDSFLAPPAVADLLATSPGQLAKLRMRGEGPPFVKLGRSVLYRLGDLRQWAADQNSGQRPNATTEGL